MKKYVLEVKKGQKNTAGQKAKEDITNILTNLNFNKVQIKIETNKLKKLLCTGRHIKSGLKGVKSEDIIVIQYPMYSRYALKLVLKECKKRNIKTIGILHDVESLRWSDAPQHKKKQELKLFKKFDCLIVHNSAMHKWLLQKLGNTPMIDLEIFDYINNKRYPQVSRNRNLVFAGNLGKSTFLEKWNLNKKITVYGINPSSKYPDNLVYKGVKTPDELPEHLSGSFGLVWDGDSLDTNSGIFGEYTKYNNPHKASLYLSCGLPVIVWKEAAVANFILENNLGIVVSSISEIENILVEMNDQAYIDMLKNVRNFSQKIRNGFFIENAVNKAVKLI
ncbi:sugar transferase [Pediococcus acidilactici]|uniref:sugar transferase n=1 Tax=Pediococcus acidilactici TaxID=1254 RepID=UPI0018AA0B81|nr:sugar transferase [Pediococcus acidilactici]